MHLMEPTAMVAAIVVLAGCASAGADSNKQPIPLTKEEMAAQKWILAQPDRVRGWMTSVQHKPKQGEPRGLFAFSTDSKIPYCIVSTAIAWAYADICGGIEKMPGYHPKAKQEMAAWVQKFQDPKSRQFIDPLHESCVADIKDPKTQYSFREAVSKYSRGLLIRCGAEPLYPYVFGGNEEGKLDPKHYFEFIKDGDWDNQPWAIGSHAALQTVQLFELVNKGQDDLIPALKQGAEFIISKQNPKTGMWGVDKASLDQQIGGTLKVIGRFQWYMGMIVPHMDKLADSVIANHRSGGFNKCESPCVPRNVAEMAYACMEASDYRKAELRQVVIELVGDVKRYQREDGGFSSSWEGIAPIGWCQSIVADKSEKPRSDLIGCQLNVDTAIRMYHRLGWPDSPWPAEKNWRQAIKDQGNKYEISCDANGKVSVTPAEE